MAHGCVTTRPTLSDSHQQPLMVSHKYIGHLESSADLGWSPLIEAGIELGSLVSCRQRLRASSNDPTDISSGGWDPTSLFPAPASPASFPAVGGGVGAEGEQRCARPPVAQGWNGSASLLPETMVRSKPHTSWLPGGPDRSLPSVGGTMPSQREGGHVSKLSARKMKAQPAGYRVSLCTSSLQERFPSLWLGPVLPPSSLPVAAFVAILSHSSLGPLCKANLPRGALPGSCVPNARGSRPSRPACCRLKESQSSAWLGSPCSAHRVIKASVKMARKAPHSPFTELVSGLA